MKKRLAVILITVLLLVVTVFPGMAKSDTKPISGTCYIYKWSGEEAGGLTDDPKFRIWEPDGMSHWRNQLWLFACDFDDDRLDGYMLLSDNWNLNFHESKNGIAQTFGKTYSADENGNFLNEWEGSFVGTVDQNFNIISRTEYKGLGINKGLHVQFTLTGLGFYVVTGELTDTGK